ncbi:MAG: hypothetical protein QM715_02320 [Nibricoccus sp.]
MTRIPRKLALARIPKELIGVALAALSCAVWFVISADEIKYLIAPMGATVLAAAFFWTVLKARRPGPPLADPATLTVLAVTCYTIIPPLQYLLAGGQHTYLSAYQLYVLNPTPRQFGGFMWWYVVYLVAFVSGYLAFDSRRAAAPFVPNPPDRRTVALLVALWMALSVVMYAIEAIYGINLYGVYDVERMYDSYEVYLGMPLLFRQFYGIIGHNGVGLIVKLGLLLTLFLGWEKPVYRLILYCWLAVIVISNILWMGARTELVLILLACVIMYNEFVRRLKIWQMLTIGLCLFVGFLLIGFVRGQATLGSNLTNFKSKVDSFELTVSTNTEFQALFGGNFDLLRLKESGELGEIPVQFTLYDVVMVVPQQLLPFPKLDVQNWIAERALPGFFMFSPISQAIIGYGWVELIARGMLLGFVFAKARIWYVRSSRKFWPTLAYFYLIVIAYYTIRGTAFYILIASFLFRFLPLYLLLKILQTKTRQLPVPPAKPFAIGGTAGQ